MNSLHWLADWWVDDPKYLDSHQPLKDIMTMALQEAGFQVVGTRWHDFQPKGFTGVLLLKESHIAVHSWWEEGLLTLDVFTCRPEGLGRFTRSLREAIRPKAERSTRIPRGVRGSTGRGISYPLITPYYLRFADTRQDLS